jgi:hypothetical protein
MRRSGGIDSSPTAWKRCGQKWVYYIYNKRYMISSKWSEMIRNDQKWWVWYGCGQKWVVVSTAKPGDFWRMMAKPAGLWGRTPPSS